MNDKIVVLGVFVADTSYRAKRQPRIGETILGSEFTLGPGGKGSNQAVAIAKLGGNVNFVSRLGRDQFAEMAYDIWQKSGVKPVVIEDSESFTGAAYIFVDEATGDNAIIICPGAANRITVADIEQNSNLISDSRVFITQLEQPLPAAKKGLEVAKSGGSTTILNPAPAAQIGQDVLSLCDYITPNETEAEEISGVKIISIEDAEAASNVLIRLGCGSVVITLGENGAYFNSGSQSEHIRALHAGEVVETTGAGDAFNGGFAYALANNFELSEAVRFGCATAAISVTRAGTAPSMPSLEEVRSLLGKK